MSQLFSPCTLKGKTLKNRVIIPAMLVCDIPSRDGSVGQQYLDHFKWMADRGAGMVVAGAACTTPGGMMHACQLAAWSDQFIDGLSKIAEICHATDTKTILLINHAGASSVLTRDRFCSSEYANGARAMTKDEIKAIQQDYIDAAVRAEKAGFDGVEIQCAHNYLINTFFSADINKRTDEYGGSPQNRARMATEIIKGIRQVTADDFIISCRMAAIGPKFEDSIAIAKELEAAGVDLLDISHGDLSLIEITAGDGPEVPNQYPYHWMTYGASMIKQNVSVPVVAVWNIGSDQAQDVISSESADFAAVLRGILVDPDWVQNAEKNRPSNKCYNCKPICLWFYDRTKCPAWNKLDPSVRL